MARPFSYTRDAPFARGAHRGADLAARPGTPIRSACGGTVIHAGPVARQGRVVSVQCGGRRVSYLPLATVAVRAGATVGAGAPIGIVAAGHGGLHVGVRREADRFGYEDPLALLPSPGPTRPPSPVAVERPRRSAPRPAFPRVAGPRPAPVPRVAAPRSAVPHVGSPPVAPPALAAPHLTATPRAAPPGVAPWPVWAGLALLLSGAAGSGAVVVRRRRPAGLERGSATQRPCPTAPVTAPPLASDAPRWPTTSRRPSTT
ncbi:MAG TPA: peptidoglycan DD-metalloendopeptidase family protein [Solirubrobacteraceae bacterium]|nr:peptidoglycan DD-metalloendopeptidase family protein [Solirubrobacteraceae bacterium]